MLKITETTMHINRRFFEALEILKSRREISGINEFAKKYKAPSANLYTIKNNGYGMIKAEWLHHLVRDYGISGNWLLTGEGNMFSSPPVTSHSSTQTFGQCQKDGRKVSCPYILD